MAERIVHCAKLQQDLPGLDEASGEGRSALKMALVLGGTELRHRVFERVSLEAWRMWKDHMRMVINEYRLDATSDESNPILCEHLEAFLFGQAKPIEGYVPPGKKPD